MQMQEEKRPKNPHNLILQDRKMLTIGGVVDVDSFDEQTTIVFTEMGELTVKGSDLHINKLNVDTGELTIEGTIDCLSYSNIAEKSQGGFFSKIFK